MCNTTIDYGTLICLNSVLRMHCIDIVCKSFFFVFFRTFFSGDKFSTSFLCYRHCRFNEPHTHSENFGSTQFIAIDAYMCTNTNTYRVIWNRSQWEATKKKKRKKRPKHKLISINDVYSINFLRCNLPINYKTASASAIAIAIAIEPKV